MDLLPSYFIFRMHAFILRRAQDERTTPDYTGLSHLHPHTPFALST